MPFTGVAALISGSKNTEYIVSGLAVNSKCLLQDVTICADKIHKMFDFVRFVRSIFACCYSRGRARASRRNACMAASSSKLAMYSWSPISRARTSGRRGAAFRQERYFSAAPHAACGSAVHRGGPHSSSSGGNAPADGAQRRMPPYRPKSGTSPARRHS